MTHLSIIGTGTMGQAISAVVTKGGNTAELLGRSDAGQPVTGALVKLINAERHLTFMVPSEAQGRYQASDLPPGQYKIEARKDGKPVRQELVTVARNGRQVVRISQEAGPLTAAIPGRRALPPSRTTNPAQRSSHRSVAPDGSAYQVTSRGRRWA